MRIDFSDLPPKKIYGWMIQLITPRPIAWVLSENDNNSYNLAPFSYFNGVTSKPPIISVSVGKKRDGSKKDTWTNIESRERFVVHIPSTKHADSVNESAAALPYGETEVSRAGIELIHDSAFPIPRIDSTVAAMYCELHQIVEVGDGPQALILGEIKQVWVDDAILDTTVDIPHAQPDALDPLSRLGGDSYASLGTVFDLPRPG